MDHTVALVFLGAGIVLVVLEMASLTFYLAALGFAALITALITWFYPLQDWQALPFPVRPSRDFGIPAVAESLRIHELNIVHSQEIGSHVFFVCRVASGEELSEGTQLHHTPAYYQAYRRHLVEAFAEV